MTKDNDCDYCGFPKEEHPIKRAKLTCNLVYDGSEPTPLPFSELHSLKENDKLEWQSYWQDKFIMPELPK